MCNLQRYRTRVCDSEPCVGDDKESEYCACVPLDAAGVYVRITFCGNDLPFDRIR